MKKWKKCIRIKGYSRTDAEVIFDQKIPEFKAEHREVITCSLGRIFDCEGDFKFWPGWWYFRMYARKPEVCDRCIYFKEGKPGAR